MPPPPYCSSLTSTDELVRRREATSRSARRRSEHVALAVEGVELAPTSVCGGRIAPARVHAGFAEGESIARTLKSFLRVLNGSFRTSAVETLTSRWNLSISIGGVSLAEDERSTFAAGAVLEHGPQLSQPADRRGSRRATRDRPRSTRFAERVLGAALFQHDLHRRLRPRKAQRFWDVRCSVLLAGRLPFAVDRREAARVDDACSCAVDHLEQILAEVDVVHQLRAAARPRAVRDDALERDDSWPTPPEWK